MEKLVGVNVGSVHIFKGHATSLYIVMLFSGHRFTDAGIDAMGSFLDPFDRGVS